MIARLALAAPAVALAALSLSATAHAQSTVRYVTVRASGGAGFHLAGGFDGVDSGPTVGGSLALEVRPIVPLSLQVELAATYIPVGVPAGSNLPGFVFDGAANLGVGVHLPFGLYFAARGGLHDAYQSLRGGLEGEVGWDFYATPGFSVGPFIRAAYLFGAPDADPLATFIGGLTIALGPASPVASHTDATEAPSDTSAPRPSEGGGEGTTTSAGSTSSSVSSAPSAPPEDGDHDGVPDAADSCPGSPAGSAVDSTGCAPSASGGAPHHRAGGRHHGGGHPHHAPRRRRRHSH